MIDFAKLLCCFNNIRIYCLQYICLIISLLIFPANCLGIFIIEWDFVNFYCEILYSINISISIFIIVIISIIVHSTKIGRIFTSELYKSFALLSTISIIIFIYVFISYTISSFEIWMSYLTSRNYQYMLNGRKKIKTITKLTFEMIILISLSTILLVILSFLNILVWISICIRINYRIYCSFNKDIRKELRNQRKLNRELITKKDSIDNSSSNKDIKEIKNKEKDFISVVIEKDRHPNFLKYDNNQNDYQTNKIKNKNDDGIPSYLVSSERNLKNQKIFINSNKIIK